MSCLPGWRSPAQHPIDVAARLKRTAENAAPSEPLWRRTARVAALGTTLGVGASGTLLLALWQAQDQLQRNRADQKNEARQLLANVTQGLQDFNGSCPSVNDTVVNQTAVLLDLRASPALRPLDRAGLDRLIDHLSEQCAQPANPVGVCLPRHQRMHSDLCAQVLRPTVTDTALNYWSPAISPAEQAAAAQRFWHTVAARGPAARPTPPTAPPLREACWRSDGGFNRIYLQIYDEASRRAATAFAQQLKAEVGAWVQVAPLDNVTRSAELRGQRRPVPWAQPTWVAHDTAAHRCAHALAQHLGPGEKGAAWVRSLPPALPAQAGVMELWWPPSGAMAATP